MFISFGCRLVPFIIRINCLLWIYGWMCCSCLSRSRPFVTSLHNLVLATQLLRFARRFSHISLSLPPLRAWNGAALCFSWPSNIYIPWHFGMLKRERLSRRTQTEAKMMPDLEKTDTWGKEERLKRREDNTRKETGRLNVGMKPSARPYQTDQSGPAQTEGSLCGSQSVRSSAAVRPQHGLIYRQGWNFFLKTD